jgi:hypothetical protein
MRSSVLLGAPLLVLSMVVGACGNGSKGARDAAPTDGPTDMGVGDAPKVDMSTSDTSDTSTSDTSTSDTSTADTSTSDTSTSDTSTADASDASVSDASDASVSDAADATVSDAADATVSDAVDASADVARTCVDAGGVDAGAGCFGTLALFNTGVDATGAALAGGSVDPHYKLIVSPDSTFTGPDAIVTTHIAEGYWVPQSATAKWIAPSANQSYPGATPCNASGTYAYRTTFDLTGFDPATARITGQWGADNSGTAVRLNGVSLGITAGSYSPLTAFTISAGFTAGVNTLEFELLDLGCPSGLRVELSGVAAYAR